MTNRQWIAGLWEAVGYLWCELDKVKQKQAMMDKKLKEKEAMKAMKAKKTVKAMKVMKPVKDRKRKAKQSKAAGSTQRYKPFHKGTVCI